MKPINHVVAWSALFFTILFLTLPGIDLWVSGLFFGPERTFLLKGNAFFDLAKRSVDFVVLAYLAGSLYFWLPRRLGLVPERLLARRRDASFVLLVLLVGPGLLVNGIFKQHWDRARPSQIDLFDGERYFTPAWVIADQCEKNCAFVCGDCSVGFMLVALAFVSRHPYRWLAIGLAAGGFYGFMRMGQGGHFLSDVIFSFYAVYFTAWLLHRWMYASARPGAPAPR